MSLKNGLKGKLKLEKNKYHKIIIFRAAFSAIVVLALFVSAPASAAGERPTPGPVAAEAEKLSAKPEKYQVEGIVESVSAPVNPRETLMVVDCGDSTVVELIISPATRYFPYDYYPCVGDKVKVNYAVIGIFKKYAVAYGVSLLEEFSGATRNGHKILKKREN